MANLNQTKETKPVKDRAYYKEIFYQFWNQYNYIPVRGIHGDVEHLIELNDSYPPYWFATSHGRVFSVKGGKFKQLQPNHVLAGRSRNENKWYYVQGDGKHRYIHQMVAEHCCENPWGDDVKVEVHHITPTKKFGAGDAFIANQAGNLQYLPKKIHDTVGYFAKKEHEDIFEEKMAKAPIEIQVPDVTEWVCSILNTGAVSDLGMYKYEDLKESQFRDHDVSYTFVKNPKIEPIEGDGYLITNKYIFFAEGNGNFLQENKNMLDNAMDTLFSDCINSEKYFDFEFEDKAKDKNILISVKLKEIEE